MGDVLRTKKKIFVSAYACEPDKGSEIGVGWHWVLAMSLNFELWVMTRETNRENIENWIEKNGNPGIHFVYFDLDEKYRRWKNGEKNVRKYYAIWQRLSENTVRRTMEENNIDTYHLLTYGNVFWSASKYGMSRKFIWGPVGGTDVVDDELLRGCSLKSRALEAFRNIASASLVMNPGFRKRCRKANLIMCKTVDTYDKIPEKYKDKALICTDVGIERILAHVYEDTQLEKNEKNCVKYFACGRLDGWRGYHILIKAFSMACRHTDKDLRLEIAGTGTEKKRLALLINKCNMKGEIKLLGKIDKKTYETKLDEADVLVNPTLREGGVTFAFDGMARCKPMICVDTGGYTGCFDGVSCMIKKSIARNTTADMAKAILESTDENFRKKISKRLSQISSRYLWKNKAEDIGRMFGEALK